jgi:hypothetical protein
MRFNESMGLRGFFLHYKTIKHPGNIHTFTLTQGQTQRDMKGTAFLPEVFVLCLLLCAAAAGFISCTPSFYSIFHSQDYTHPTQRQQIDFS